MSGSERLEREYVEEEQKLATQFGREKERLIAEYHRDLHHNKQQENE